MLNEKFRKFGVPALAFALTFILLYTNIFFTWDKILSDTVCQTGDVPDSRIFIVAIDDKTLQEYGPMNQWSRDISRQVVETLNQDETKRPAIITFDIMYLENTDEAVDQAFADACAKAGNVVTAYNLQFKEQPEMDEKGKVTFNQFYIDEVDYPIDALKESADYGYANTIVDEDGYVRRFMPVISQDGKEYFSLATQTYIKYMESQGKAPAIPFSKNDNLIPFKYACGTGGYSVVSLCDVLNGKVNPAIFTNGIVFVGAYASGLMDSYVPAISHGTQMYGVEIQASITDALLNFNYQQEVSKTVYALVASVLVAAYAFFSQKLKVVPSGILMAVLAIGSVVVAKVSYDNGYILPILVLPLMLIISYAANVILGYIAEIKRRKQIVGVFKQYMAPQIVDEISKKKDFKVELGGERRHIAVLFVDIRGFTTMSEVLKPEEVVEILNEYLSLTTQSIFNNNGTLDKFVGDATMAVFNAPLDLDDYIYRAVKTAWDMKAGSEALAEKFEKRFGRSVAFGIGVNCGDAVVGNIGCEFRMDYTAIGDTVNTAARLESNAKRGQILISQEVYDNVKDRVEVTPIGELPLKGKEVGVFIYQVDNVK
ncbi:MAG: adenylate/guanylate cyclase domain-containing protein [Agathobacter sp.]|nr:adenylate/guanylate cyclase domain-containing protein [Agathobacter sp.]